MFSIILASLGFNKIQAAIVAFDLVNGGSSKLNSFTDAPEIPFSSGGDGFQKYTRNPGNENIPFDLADDSISVFTTDTQGIVDETDLNPFFGLVDTVNSDTTGSVSAIWEFNVSGASELWVSIDVAAMGDFESSDVVGWTYSIDGGDGDASFRSRC